MVSSISYHVGESLSCVATVRVERGPRDIEIAQMVPGKIWAAPSCISAAQVHNDPEGNRGRQRAQGAITVV